MDHLSTAKKATIATGVVIGILLSTLDQTIVSTSLPQIIHDFENLRDSSWVFTAYMLAMTAVIPVAGKLSDMYGRRWFFLGGLIVFTIGSELCGLSSSMLTLIFSRVIQGIGAGIIAINASAILGDIFPPAERGKWQWLTGALIATFGVLGPAIGGWLTDVFSWRYSFFVNVPFCIFSFLLVWWCYQDHTDERGKKRIDYMGAFSITAFLLCFILLFETNGQGLQFSLATAVFGLSSIVFFLVFMHAERHAQDPILPLELFYNRTFSLILLITFLASIALFGVMIYIPLFLQRINGLSAAESGFVLTPLMLCLALATIINGQLVSRRGKYKVSAILGLASMCTASAILINIARLDYLTIQMAAGLLGLGIGMHLPVLNIAILNACEHSRIGVVTASVHLMRNIGGSVLVAALGIFTSASLATGLESIRTKLHSRPIVEPWKILTADDVSQILNGHFLSIQGKFDNPDWLGQIAIVSKTRELFSLVIAYDFALIALSLLIATILMCLVEEKPLRKHNYTLEKAGKELEMELLQLDAKREPKLS